MNISKTDNLASPAQIIDALEGQASRYETPCGNGTMVWRRWGAGNPGRPPIILAHGGSGSWTHWLKTIAVLSERCEVWAVDLPGLGDSAMPPAPLTPESSAAVLAAGFCELFADGRRPHLVGFSFGGHVATLAAVELGARLASLTLCGSASLGLERTPLQFAKERPRMSDAERAEVHRYNLQVLMFADPANIDGLAIHIQAQNVARARFRSQPFAMGTGIVDALPLVTVPLRAIWGGRDVIAKPSAQACLDVLRRHHPALVSRLIPEAGHWMMYETPEAFNRALNEILGPGN